MDVVVVPNCGNAPKLQRIVDLVIALAGRDIEAAHSLISENFVWIEVGKDEIANPRNLDAVLAGRPAVRKLSIDNALSHGRGAMCEGELDFEDGDRLLFCAVGEFNSLAKDAVVKEIRFYFA